MRWTERQRAMLREMGLEMWARPGSSPQLAEAAEPAAQAAPAARAEQELVETGVAATVAELSHEAPPPSATRSRPVAASAWDALHQDAAQCACGRGIVLGSGHAQAHWMLIGDAPDGGAAGSDGFAGPAGVLLDNMLRALELTRADAAPSRQVYVASVPPCATGDDSGATPGCAELLLRQVQLVQPRVIVAMGRVAAQTLSRSRQPLGQLRGRLHRHAGIALVCTYHPAYLLRNPEDKARAWDDLCLALEASQAPA